MRTTTVVTVALLFSGPSLALGQAPPASAPPAAPAATAGNAAALARAAQEAVEDLVLTRVLAGLQMTQSQLAELLPLIDDTQDRLRALDRENADAVARHKPALEEALRQLLAEKAPSSRAETQYSETLQRGQSKRTKLRADLVASLKQNLAKQLGPTQEALLVQTARSIASQERTAGWRADALTGNRGGGPIVFMGSLMDRMRQLSPEEFAQQQQRLAAAGAAGGRGGEQMAGMLAQVRGLTSEAYAQQKNDLALRVIDGRLSAQPQDPQAEIDRLLDRYFLSPRLPDVMRQQLGAGPGH